MKTNKLWFFLFVLILATSCKNDDEEVLIGNWTKVGDFEGYQREGASYFVLGDSVYVGLGYNGTRRLKDFWKYDVSSDTWKSVSSLPESAKQRSNASAFATDTKGYICAGWGGEEGDLIYLKDLWEYNPSNGSWIQKSDMPNDAVARYDAVGIGYKNKGYVGTGKSEDSQLKDFYEYNPTTDQWKSLASVGGSKRQGAISFVVSNTIYVCLGVSNNQYLTDLWAYNVEQDKWEKKNDMRNATDESFDDKYNMARAYGVSFVLNDKAYITLGTSGSLRLDTWEYEPVSDRWYQKTAFEGAGRTKAVGFSIYDKKANKQRGFVATGGSSNTRFDDVWEFKPNEEKNDRDNS